MLVFSYHIKNTIKRRLSAVPLASARFSRKTEAAMAPDPNEVGGRHAPNRGCREATGVKKRQT